MAIRNIQDELRFIEEIEPTFEKSKQSPQQWVLDVFVKILSLCRNLKTKGRINQEKWREYDDSMDNVRKKCDNCIRIIHRATNDTENESINNKDVLNRIKNIHSITRKIKNNYQSYKQRV